ncbi:MAG: sensor histidine kinase [Myxococcota bacterium]
MSSDASDSAIAGSPSVTGPPHAGTPDPAEPGRAAPEPGPGGGEPGPVRVRQAIDDRWLVLTLVPAFGLGIPHAAGLFASLGPRDPAYWWGHLWFLCGAGLVYGANRALLFAGRTHADWFSRPVAKLVLLATGIVFGTVPTTAIMMHFWSALSGVPLGDGLQTVLLVNVICVLFVTWLYETLFLIRERVDDQVALTRAEAARTRAELDALRAQVDPHFLFNALNTLAALTEARPAEARRFVDHLARLYRSSLDTRGRALVALSEELELARAYAALVGIRFGDAVQTEIVAPEDPGRWWVPPGAAQVLLENVVRHNTVDPDDPLRITVDASDGALVVTHAHRPRRGTRGAGVGLANLDARVRAAIGRPIAVERGREHRVTVPMLRGPG